MTTANVLFLILSVSAFTLFGVALFINWMSVTVLGGARPDPVTVAQDAPPVVDKAPARKKAA